jgi:hypothetical protein
MHTKRKQTAQLGIISAIVLTAVSASRAADFTVDGNLKVNKDAAILGKARIDGNVGVGAANSGADLQISQTGLGVGIFLGDRAPFGQALFEPI